MIHRMALLMGGTGAAGVVVLALLLGGFGAPLASTTDAAAAPTAGGLGGGQLPAMTPGQVLPTVGANLAGGAPEKVIDTVYVMPVPAGNDRGRSNDDAQPTDSPRPPSDVGNDNADDNDGDSQAGDDQGDDSDADEADDDAGDDHDEDGSEGDESHDGDHEPGDD